VGKDIEKLECLHTIGRNAKWYNTCGKQYGGSSKKLKITLPYDLVISLLDVYSKDLKAGPEEVLAHPYS
jgi:hypothetical protein